MEYVIEPQVRRFCGPLFFTTSPENVLDITNNGSFGLVDTGKKRLLITCYHVWDEFLRKHSKNPDLKMLIWLGNPEATLFAPASALSEHPEFDLATFDMEPYLASCNERKFYPLHQNPPHKVKCGDAMFFIGFPGHLRGLRGSEGKWMFGRAPYGMVVREVSEDNRHFFVDISKLMAAQQDDEFGGISGCPCFFVPRGQGRAELAGFATSIVLNPYLRFTHASCLKQDGSFNEPISKWL